MKLIENYSGGMCAGNHFYNPLAISRIGEIYEDGCWMGFDVILIGGFKLNVPIERDKNGERKIYSDDVKRQYNEYIKMVN